MDMDRSGEQPSDSSGIECSVCLRPMYAWPAGDSIFYPPQSAGCDKGCAPAIFSGVDSYKNNYNRCISCESLFVGSFRALGTERMAKGSPVPGKIGMLKTVGALITKKRSTVLASEKVINKMPTETPIKAIRATGKDVIRHFLDTDFEFPALLISDIGVKKAELMRSLRMSLSPERLHICSADETITINKVLYREILKDLSQWSATEKNKFVKKNLNYSTGKLSPDDFMQQLNGKEYEVAKKLPADPHQKITIAGLL